MTSFVVVILILVSLILLGAVVQKPHGWIVIGFAVLAMLLQLSVGVPLFR